MEQKEKPKLNITTKGLSIKKIIISIGSKNIKWVITKTNANVVNIDML